MNRINRVTILEKRSITTMISVTIFILFLTAIVYLVITGYGINNDGNVEVKNTGKPIFTALKTDNVAIDVDLEKENITKEANMSVALSSDNDSPCSCSYDIYWVWLSHYEKSLNINEELIVSGKLGNEERINRVQLGDSKEKKTLLYSAEIIKEKTGTEKQEWNFEISFIKNSNYSQMRHNKKTYKGYISVENTNCFKERKEIINK